MNEIIELPDVSIEVNGSIALIDNLGPFGDALTKYLAGLNKSPVTDEDFGAPLPVIEAIKPSVAAHREYVSKGPQDAPTGKPRPSNEAIIRALSLYFKTTPEEVQSWISFKDGGAA